MSNPDAPEVIAWRLTTLETKVDKLHAKLDAMREHMQSNNCPEPGLCISLREACMRLEKVSERHEKEISGFKAEFDRFRGGARVLVGMAVIAQAAVSFLFQFLK